MQFKWLLRVSKVVFTLFFVALVILSKELRKRKQQQKLIINIIAKTYAVININAQHNAFNS